MRGMAARMTGPAKNRNIVAGGAPLAFLLIAGPIVAGLMGYSPSIGFLVGLALGVAIAVAIWFFNAR
jgi:hypothetical protein